MKKFLAPLLLTCALVGCGESTPNAERATSEATKRLQAEANSQIGLPRIKNFTEKRLATKLAELRDKPDLVTFTYVQGIDGRLRCLGRSIGFGIPYSTQITNPQREEYYSAGPITLPQAEPNGLYMPESASATWVMLVNPTTGEASPIYVEPNITVSTFELKGGMVAEGCPQ